MSTAQYPKNKIWSTREITIACCLGISYGVLWLGWTPLYDVVKLALKPLPMLGEVLREIMKGVWFGAGVLVPYVIRRPGAAVLGETVGALVEMTLWGLVDGLLQGVIQGLSSEAVFAFVGRYRNYRTPVLMLAGGLPALTTFLFQYGPRGYSHFPLWVQLGKLGVRFGSGMILGGLVAKGLGDLLIKTRVLRAPSISTS